MKKTHPIVATTATVVDELVDILDKKAKLEDREKEIKTELRAAGFEEWLKHKGTASVQANGTTKNALITFSEGWRGWDIAIAGATLPPVLVPHVKSVIGIKIDLSELPPSVQAITTQAIKDALTEVGLDLEKVLSTDKKAYPQATFTDTRKDLTLAENLAIDDVLPAPQTIKVVK